MQWKSIITKITLTGGILNAASGAVESNGTATLATYTYGVNNGPPLSMTYGFEL